MRPIIPLLEAALPKPPKQTRDVETVLRCAIPQERRNLVHRRITEILVNANLLQPTRRELYLAGSWLRKNGFRYFNRTGGGGYFVPFHFNPMPVSYPLDPVPCVPRTLTAILRDLKIKKPTYKEMRTARQWMNEKGFEQVTEGYLIPVVT